MSRRIRKVQKQQWLKKMREDAAAIKAAKAAQ